MSAPAEKPGAARRGPEGADAGGRAAELQRLHEARARAELVAADLQAPGSDRVRPRGALLAEVTVVKGLPGPAEATGGRAMSGADGEAAVKALEALGHDPAGIFFTLSRPEPGLDASARALRLRAQIEAVDAPVVVAVDEEAAEDLAAAFELDRLPFGREVRACGRRLVAADGLEASLGDEGRKQTVWRQLKAARPEPPIY